MKASQAVSDGTESSYKHGLVRLVMPLLVMELQAFETLSCVEILEWSVTNVKSRCVR